MANTPSRDLEFYPVVNGVDFLGSAISRLLLEDDPQSLKYAVLHLQAAAEILLKVRLQREGFQHIFLDPYDADETKLAAGKFRSVPLRQAIQRLAVVAGIKLEESEVKALDRLNEERNKLQHFGSTSAREVVTARATKALEVLAHFILEHLVPDAPEQEGKALGDARDLIRHGVTKIDAATQGRLLRLKDQLDASPSIVIHCPDCHQMAWTFNPHDETSRCRFCHTDWSRKEGPEAAALYVEEILDESHDLAVQGRSGWSIRHCPDCGAEALVPAATREAPDEDTDICFECGLTATAPLGVCGRCGSPTSDLDTVLCWSCRNELMARD